MNKTKMFVLVAAIVALGSVEASAAVSADEAKALGTTLTPFGSEMAGSKDGLIPAYNGGLTTPPPDFKPGSIKRSDPYANEKPLFSITPQNMAQYADGLSDGVKGLFKRDPGYRIDVYPSHRTVAYPKNVIDNTVKNATRCKTINGGLSVEGCYGGIPFPIPKDGYEVIWNHLLRYQGFSVDATLQHWYVDADGRPVHITSEQAREEYPYYNPNATGADIYWQLRDNITGPARLAGESSILIDALDPVKTDRKIWQYLSGQRRTRAAPDLSYDTPIPNRGGIGTMDDIDIFNGKMDRFDWKLIGKKEMIIPYNNYKLVYGFGTTCGSPEKLFTPMHVNPDCVRWEKQRVWIVEATLKPNKRHIYKKRVFYFDEDSWGGGAMTDIYDATGALYRVGFLYPAPRYDAPAPTSFTFQFYDLVRNAYLFAAWFGCAECGITKELGKAPASTFNPDTLAGGGVR